VIRIEFKLFASLMVHLPPGTKGHSVSVEVPDGTTVQGVIDRFNVPGERAHLVVCNGVIVHRANRDQRQLDDGDVVALWPPVAGG
jgi:molybdopterin converting factor small subunit